MILVTGGTGLVGSNLLFYLSEIEDKIIATYRCEKKINLTKKIFSKLETSQNSTFSKIHWIKSDICDISSLEKIFLSHTITQVYHCAGLVSFDPKKYLEMRKVNIEGTANMINFSIAFSIDKFCFVSSIATLGNSIKGKPISEEDDLYQETNMNDYAISKYGAEMEVWRGSQEGLKTVIVNPGVILGSGFNNGSCEIIDKVKKGFKFYTEGKTGFVGVKDVVSIMIKLMNTKIDNERYILVSENKTFKKVLFLIADKFKMPRPNIKVSLISTSIFWRVNLILSKIFRIKTVLTKHTAKSITEVESYTSEKIKLKLNYHFEPIKEVVKTLY